MSEAMTKKHIPHLDPIATRHGNPGDMGDGILMGVAAGGQAINMGEAFVGIAHYPPSQLTLGIFVNGQSQRFINEDIHLGRLDYYAAMQPTDEIYMFTDNKHFAPGLFKNRNRRSRRKYRGSRNRVWPAGWFAATDRRLLQPLRGPRQRSIISQYIIPKPMDVRL